MSTRSGIGFVLVILFLVSCNIPGVGNTPEAKPMASEVIQELPTSTIQPEYPTEVTATDTPVLIDTPTISIIPSPTPYPDIWYILQLGTPLATYNIPHEEAGCSWLGVGGQVFGPDSLPILGLSIIVGGTLEGYQVGGLGTTGMETNIGEGGYEVTLADHPVDSNGTVWIQVVDDIGNPLSERIPFNTMNDCDRNFILINFVRYQPSLSGTGWTAYLPIIVNRTGIQAIPVP